MLSTPGFLEGEIAEHIGFINKESTGPGAEIANSGLDNTESELLSTVIANVSDPLQETLNFSNASDAVNSSAEVIVTESVTESTAGSTETPLAKKCPRRGICVFWLLARDQCTSNDDCEKSKLCCKVWCSKRCIDV